MYLRVAVSKGEAGGAIVIATRVVDDLGTGETRVSIHLGHEVTVVDAVLALIEDNKCHGRPGTQHGAKLGKYDPTPNCTPVTFIERGRIAIPANPIVHGITAYAGDSNTCFVDSIARIGWAMPDCHGISAVWPDWALAYRVIIIPVALHTRIRRIAVKRRAGGNPCEVLCT